MRGTRFFVAATALLFAALTPQAAADERYAAIVVDAFTGEVLHEDLADARRYPASLAKMMTLYLLFEAIERGDIREDDVLTASRAAARQPRSSLGLRAGDQLTVEEAILSIVVHSANDVAVVIGERLAGSEARFGEMMTARAQELGLTRTRFINASGLPDDRQQTTARDMARLSWALWNDFPGYYCYFQTASFTWGDVTTRNHNHLLTRVDGVDGIKTGYTRVSGFNLASSAQRNGRRVIVVVMGGETASSRDAQATYLIDAAFEEFAQRDGEITAHPTSPLLLTGGASANVPVVVGQGAEEAADE